MLASGPVHGPHYLRPNQFQCNRPGGAICRLGTLVRPNRTDQAQRIRHGVFLNLDGFVKSLNIRDIYYLCHSPTCPYASVANFLNRIFYKFVNRERFGL